MASAGERCRTVPLDRLAGNAAEGGVFARQRAVDYARGVRGNEAVFHGCRQFVWSDLVPSRLHRIQTNRIRENLVPCANDEGHTLFALTGVLGI